jgi:hypothetical protein
LSVPEALLGMETPVTLIFASLTLEAAEAIR